MNTAEDGITAGLLDLAADRYLRLYLETLAHPGMAPRTFIDGAVTYVHPEDWTSGFFAGSLWLLFALTRDDRLKTAAREATARLERLQHFTGHHDLGFMVGCSYGGGYHLGQIEDYRPVLVQAARSLLTRFSAVVGCIRSWDSPRWSYPVIIDNLMNLELLFDVAEMTGDPSFANAAVSHGLRSLEHHFRPDGSSFHVVDFDPATGVCLRKKTHQGFADKSAWARGQAWGLYGCSMLHERSGNTAFLQQAMATARFIMEHPRLPSDGIPFWDFDAPAIPEEPRDASAGAITAAGLLRLASLVHGGERNRLVEFASHVLATLSRTPYIGDPSETGGFLLTGATGHRPQQSEVGVPLAYADYYFLEAIRLIRRL